MQFANQLLNDFKSNDQAWRAVDKIIDLAADNNVKFFALQILDEAINVSHNRFVIKLIGHANIPV